MRFPFISELFNKSSSICVATLPIFSRGCLIVVNPGRVSDACGISSNPIMEILSGMCSPRLRTASITPIAITSFDAKIAVGGSAKSKNALAKISDNHSWYTTDDTDVITSDRLSFTSTATVERTLMFQHHLTD